MSELLSSFPAEPSIWVLAKSSSFRLYFKLVDRSEELVLVGATRGQEEERDGTHNNRTIIIVSDFPFVVSRYESWIQVQVHE